MGLCYVQPETRRLSNHWVTLHEIGNVAGFVPVLVMDVWEHAFLLDYKPAERPKYIEVFFANVCWDTVGRRLEAVPVTQRDTGHRGPLRGAEQAKDARHA